MMSYLFCLAFIFMLSSVRAAQNFRKVDACPENESTWEEEARKKKCVGDTPDYMCAAIENQVGTFGEICTKHGLTPAKKCAVLNAQTYNLDSVDCKADNGCPSESYLPKVLWKYSICFKDFYGKKTTLAPGTTTTISNAGLGSESGGSGSGVVGVVVAVVIILIIVVVVVILVVFYVRNQFGFKDIVQKHIADCRQRLQHSNDPEDPQNLDLENGDANTSNVPLLNADDREQGANSEQRAKSEKAKTKEEKPVYALSVKAKTKKEKAAKTRDDEIKEGNREQRAKSEKAKTKEEQPVYALPIKAKTEKEKAAKTREDEIKEGNRVEYEEKAMRIEKLKELLKYLAHILERELDVNDLKEKTVIHSNSIRAHFSEQIMKELENVKNTDDYSQLDIGLVFILLRNFCGNLKPPSKGWGYEPVDDETHVGADIERIRLMWNKYCDDDLQFKHLDDVYNRMKQKYGTVAVYGDDDGMRKFHLERKERAEGFEIMMLKIESFKLNENSTVERGIVITDKINTALKNLQSGNVVILKGVIGCGKTHALMAIQNHYKGKKWETKWVEFQDIKGEISKDKPTILLCDNLFGRFGSCVFLQAAIDEMEEVLMNIDKSEGNIKIVIGIHTHVYDEVKKNLKINFLHQKNLTVEMDNLSDAETLLIFKEQLKKGHCKKDANCWFKAVGFQSVLDKLSKNQGHIGGPFLSLMYCSCHELFSDDAFSTSPVQTLMQHFQRIRDEKPTLYHCLVYLMCVEEHNCDEEPKEWAKMVDEDITKAALENINTSGYIHVDDNKATLSHEVLRMVLFKSTAKVQKIFTDVVKNCTDDLIIQVLRPANYIHSDFYCEIEDVNKESPFYVSRKACVYRFVCIYNMTDSNHPLMRGDFVKHKYEKYMIQPPKYKEH